MLGRLWFARCKNNDYFVCCKICLSGLRAGEC
ncbi:MAG: TRASH domain-containing protein [Paramuribaculum sp.]|nr:TRASH domain-containing protein [Paramuribaculum sp.]MDE6322614.1 TRASH domain-containing protein [Paramuribaculum sp.]MDE6488649.1 TRASH domain-containing protein [Paramuribaculum sp.]